MAHPKVVLNFTKIALDALPPTRTGERDYHNDARLQGLQVVATASGVKSFYHPEDCYFDPSSPDHCRSYVHQCSRSHWARHSSVLEVVSLSEAST